MDVVKNVQNESNPYLFTNFALFNPQHWHRTPCLDSKDLGYENYYLEPEYKYL